MNTNVYLKEVLDSQSLKSGSDELKILQVNRGNVEKIIRDRFNDCSPTIRYGGSKAKGTMIKKDYDLDIICYFPCNDEKAGETLEDIYINLENVLKADYIVQRKTSALRLQSKRNGGYIHDVYIDVVPGRFVDRSKGDAYLYQNTGEKKRLKTNLDIHIEHVKESGVIDAIRLMKLWRIRNGLSIKHFALELLVIELLKKKKISKPLPV